MYTSTCTPVDITSIPSDNSYNPIYTPPKNISERLYTPRTTLPTLLKKGVLSQHILLH